MDNYTKQSLMQKVQEARYGDRIVVEDLTTCCTSIEELAEVAMLASKKSIALRSLKQTWFDSSNQGENQIITLVKLSILQNQINKTHIGEDHSNKYK